VKLSWTAPGDDGTSGAINGGAYRIKWSTISTVDWDIATGWDDYDDKYKLEFSTNINTPLEEHSRTVTGLHGGTTYYFRIWTRDEATWSDISNASTASVVEVISVSLSTDTYNFGQIDLNTSTNTLSDITVTNDGNVNQTYSLKVSSVTLYDNSPSVWKATDTSVGHNRFMFYGVFHGVQVSTDNFNSEDIMTESSKASDGTSVFTVDQSQTGYDVPMGEDRKLWFRLDMPVSITTSKQEKITIRIEAQKQ
jgi:hypothetical protein